MNECRYIVKCHLLGVVFHNTFRYRKLAFNQVFKLLMYTSGWCTVDKEELKDEKWTLVRRWEYD